MSSSVRKWCGNCRAHVFLGKLTDHHAYGCLSCQMHNAIQNIQPVKKYKIKQGVNLALIPKEPVRMRDWKCYPGII